MLTNHNITKSVTVKFKLKYLYINGELFSAMLKYLFFSWEVIFNISYKNLP